MTASSLGYIIIIKKISKVDPKKIACLFFFPLQVTFSNNNIFIKTVKKKYIFLYFYNCLHIIKVSNVEFSSIKYNLLLFSCEK
jgi:hypothetical protein